MRFFSSQKTAIQTRVGFFRSKVSRTEAHKSATDLYKLQHVLYLLSISIIFLEARKHSSMENHLIATEKVTVVSFHLSPARILEQKSVLNDNKTLLSYLISKVTKWKLFGFTKNSLQFSRKQPGDY